MKEDEFELNTKLAISDAKTNVLLRLENNDIESTLSSDCSSDFDANIEKDCGIKQKHVFKPTTDSSNHKSEMV